VIFTDDVSASAPVRPFAPGNIVAVGPDLRVLRALCDDLAGATEVR